MINDSMNAICIHVKTNVNVPDIYGPIRKTKSLVKSLLSVKYNEHLKNNFRQRVHILTKSLEVDLKPGTYTILKTY